MGMVLGSLGFKTWRFGIEHGAFCLICRYATFLLPTLERYCTSSFFFHPGKTVLLIADATEVSQP